MTNPLPAALLADERRASQSEPRHVVVGAARLPAASTLAVGAACAYVAGFVLPFDRDIPLLVLALAGGVTTLLGLRSRGTPHPLPLLAAVVVFLLAAGLSILVSEDVARSWQLSAPLLPGVLLFLIVAREFAGPEDVRALYLAFSAVAFGLASLVLASAWASASVEPSALTARIGSPVLLVPNDCAFLAALAPLSAAVLCRKPRRVAAIVAAFSILASISAVCVLQSRVAMLTALISLSCVVALLRPRRAPLWGTVLVALVLGVDGARGFPLVAKFDAVWDSRIALWLSALAMFRDAPLLGHGAHTFGLLHGSYLSTLGLPAWLPVDTRGVPWAHNLYLETLAEQGIVGLLTLALLLAGGLTTAWRTYRASAGEARILPAGAVAALVGLCAAAVFELSFLRQWVVIVTFALLGVIARLSSVQRETPEVHR